MMVKDEESVIQRALMSALPWVDRWCVCDTGSQDGTVGLVEQTMQGVPGGVVHQLWEDFGHNRSLAFDAARELGTDYILVMDADQTLAVRDVGALSELTEDAYNIQIEHGTLTYPHPWLLRASLPWRWEGATHEYVHCDVPFTVAALPEVVLTEHADSHRRRSGAKLAEDKALLERAYADDPTNARVVFYLAQCCQDEGNWPCAIRRYQERVALGGWPEEVWCAQYRIARIFDANGPWQVAVAAYLDAYDSNIFRAEPLYHLGRGYLHRRQFNLARLFFEEAMLLEMPEGALFREDSVYHYAARQGYAWACRGLGLHDEAALEEDALLAGDHTPAQVMADIIAARLTHSFGPIA